LSAVVASLWVPSEGVLYFTDPVDLLVLGLFLMVGVLIVHLANKLTQTRHQAIDELRLREQADRQVAEILSTITDAFCTFDRQWRFVYANEITLQLLAKTEEELHDKTLWECMPGLAGTEFEERLNHALESGGDDHFELFSDQLGDWFEFRVYPSAEGLSLCMVDISERKRAAQERERLLESERNARSDSERASRLKDEFLATLSHELRTPLNAILGWATLLRLGKTSQEEVERAVETIERNAKLQAQLIDDLLDMNRIISGKLRLEVQSVDLPLVIESALQTVRPAAEAKGIRLRKRISRDTGKIVGDPTRLQQVIWNLLSNAIKFTPRDGTVEISLTARDSQVQIIVSDTGEGIANDFLPYIFDRFRQSDSSTTRRHGGLGLGLAIVRQLTELHGGWIEAASEGTGKGSTFTIHLPTSTAAISRSDGQPMRTLITQREVDAEAALTFDNLKVLVVDDEADARDLVKRILEQRHACVETAPSAAVAFEALERWHPDLLISDIGMPDEDGYQFIQRVRASAVDGMKSIPAVALTAFVRTEDRDRAMREGYQAHLSKPVMPSELLLAVHKLAHK
jgi:PAS domain S-box-containing protein